MTDWSRYIGIPYKFGSYDPKVGLFCWSLVLLVQKDVWNRDLPRIPWTARRDVSRGGAINIGQAVPNRRVSKPRAGDVVQMLGSRHGSWHPFHVGVFVDGERILHIENESAPSHIVEANRGEIKCRIKAIHRLT